MSLLKLIRYVKHFSMILVSNKSRIDGDSVVVGYGTAVNKCLLFSRLYGSWRSLSKVMQIKLPKFLILPLKQDVLLLELMILVELEFRKVLILFLVMEKYLKKMIASVCHSNHSCCRAIYWWCRLLPAYRFYFY